MIHLLDGPCISATQRNFSLPIEGRILCEVPNHFQVRSFILLYLTFLFGSGNQGKVPGSRWNRTQVISQKFSSLDMQLIFLAEMTLAFSWLTTFCTPRLWGQLRGGDCDPQTRGLSQPPLTTYHDRHKLSIPTPLLRTLHSDDVCFLPSFTASQAWLPPQHSWPLCFPHSEGARYESHLRVPSHSPLFWPYNGQTEEPSKSDSYPKPFSPSSPPSGGRLFRRLPLSWWYGSQNFPLPGWLWLTLRQAPLMLVSCFSAFPSTGDSSSYSKAGTSPLHLMAKNLEGCEIVPPLPNLER